MNIIQHPLPVAVPNGKGGFVGAWMNGKPNWKRINLHFTAGTSVESSIEWWRTQANQVSTPFLVGKDGTVTQVFDPAVGWAWHLGVGATYGEAADRTTLGVEMDNIGPLKLRGQLLFDYRYWDYTKLGSPVKSDVADALAYCSLEDVGKYVKVSDPVECWAGGLWRGVSYMAAFPREQVVGCAALVKDLCGQFKVPMVMLPKATRYAYSASGAFAFSGITTHHNWRSDKYDVGPSFQWSLFAAELGIQE